ncbi:MAG: flavodoxin-dependent (E)-4-hydroxy-3-methylbut-2-enyl-diphosphate synthase [Peptococcaceae bacterium]
MERRKTTNFEIGTVGIGSSYPISIQSMTNTDTRNSAATLRQINQLAAAGCQLVRVAVPDEEAALALKIICAESPIPVIADIHFNHRLALLAMDYGISALRINPGNIGSQSKVQEVVSKAKMFGVPIRIGVNAGSLEKDLLERYGHPTAEALVESAMRHVHMLEALNFEQIKISLKASDVPLMIAAYRLMAQKVSYPLHLGVTEAGNAKHGTVKSAVGIGTLLAEGIGDTIRVSLTGNPLQEIPVAKQILRSLDLYPKGVELISCPTCGRTQIQLEQLVNQVDQIVSGVDKPLKLAVMGCVVNGPGEAREADLGIAGGKGEGLIFRKGEIIKKVPEHQLLEAFQEELDKLLMKM